MMKTVLLGGIVCLASVIGASGVSRVRRRLGILRDLKTIENLLTEQSMTLRDALSCAAASGNASYRLLAERLSGSSDSAEKTVDESGIAEGISKGLLEVREEALLREYFIRLCESVSAAEVSLVTARFSSELGRAISGIEQNELGRAKVMRTVWTLAGIAVVIILI